MWSEFKSFAMRGNIMDLAIGVVIGGAFGKIVTSLVEDIIMPLVRLAVLTFQGCDIRRGSYQVRKLHSNDCELLHYFIFYFYRDPHNRQAET